MFAFTSPNGPSPALQAWNVLVFSNDPDRRQRVRLWVSDMEPDCTFWEVHRIADAATLGASGRLDVAVLDQTGVPPLSPLVRLLRHHSPGVRVLVFADDDTPPGSKAFPWQTAAERLRAVFRAS